MKIRSFLGAAALCVVATMAHAQQTRSALSAQNNSQIKANGVGAVTGTILNGLLGNIINSMGALTDTNSWTGANTFSNSSSVWNGAPIGTSYGGMYGAASGSIAVGNGSSALPLFVTLGTGVSAALQNSVNVSGGVASYPVAAGNLSGTSLPSAIVSSSLTSVGTLATGVWNATPIGTTYGGLDGALLNAIPYGNGAGTLPSFVAACASGVLTYTSGSAPLCSVTLPGSLTIPNPNLTGITNTDSGAIVAGGLTNGSVYYGPAPSTHLSGGWGSLTALGINVLTANTTGYSNTGVGWGALAANTTGYENTAAGQDALWVNTTGFANAAFGQAALAANVTGSNNVGVGWGALYQSTSGNNTSVGEAASFSQTSGSSNTSIGQGALYTNQTGQQNVVVGALSSYQGAAVSFSTTVGYEAGYNATGSHNTLFGYIAGLGITSGFENTVIGDQNSSSSAITTGSQNIEIGYSVQVPSPTASGQLSIGNFIYGTGLTGTGSSVSPGSIGIGVTNPHTTLEVAGPIQPDATTFAGLPACASSVEGAMRAVTDSTTVTWGATVTGGGSSHILAYCDGTNWTVAAK